MNIAHYACLPFLFVSEVFHLRSFSPAQGTTFKISFLLSIGCRNSVLFVYKCFYFFFIIERHFVEHMILSCWLFCFSVFHLLLYWLLVYMVPVYKSVVKLIAFCKDDQSPLYYVQHFSLSLVTCSFTT